MESDPVEPDPESSAAVPADVALEETEEDGDAVADDFEALEDDGLENDPTEEQIRARAGSETSVDGDDSLVEGESLDGEGEEEKEKEKEKAPVFDIGMDEIDLIVANRKVKINTIVPSVPHELGRRMRLVLLPQPDFDHLMSEVMGTAFPNPDGSLSHDRPELRHARPTL